MSALLHDILEERRQHHMAEHQRITNLREHNTFSADLKRSLLYIHTGAIQELEHLIKTLPDTFMDTDQG